MLLVIQIVIREMLWWLVNNESKEIWKEAVLYYDILE
jgi:hypothetical protein